MPTVPAELAECPALLRGAAPVRPACRARIWALGAEVPAKALLLSRRGGSPERRSPQCSPCPLAGPGAALSGVLREGAGEDPWLPPMQSAPAVGSLRNPPRCLHPPAVLLFLCKSQEKASSSLCWCSRATGASWGWWHCSCWSRKHPAEESVIPQFPLNVFSRFCPVFLAELQQQHSWVRGIPRLPGLRLPRGDSRGVGVPWDCSCLGGTGS